MLDKVTQIAEQAAESVSRRQFFGRFGRGAVAIAAGLAGALVASRNSSAGRGRPGGKRRHWECTYSCSDGATFTVTNSRHCPKEALECTLISARRL